MDGEIMIDKKKGESFVPDLYELIIFAIKRNFKLVFIVFIND